LTITSIDGSLSMDTNCCIDCADAEGWRAAEQAPADSAQPVQSGRPRRLRRMRVLRNATSF
jgi:hypothetical protein